jgi:hypothetical protein
MKRSIKEDNAHRDFGVMAIGEEGLLEIDMPEGLAYHYGLHQCIHEQTPSMLFIHPEDYYLFLEQARIKDEPHYYEDARVEIDENIPLMNYYFA